MTDDIAGAQLTGGRSRFGRLSNGSTTALLMAGLLIGAVSAGGVAVAAAATAKPTHTCVANKSGALRIAKNCLKSEHALVLGQAGARGAKGPQTPVGAAGPPGDPGATGPTGTSNVRSGGVLADGTGATAHLGTGRYCVTDSTLSNGDIAHPVLLPISTSNSQIDTGLVYTAEAVVNINCGPSSVEVDVFSFDAGSGTYHLTDAPFNYVMVTR